jgi:ComF family protein
VASAPWLHGGALAEAIHRLKYEGHFELARPLGVLFEAAVRPRAEVLVPIPLHPRRLRERGFDQARLLANAMGARFGLRVAPLLRKVRETGPQVGRDRLSRERNVRGAFSADRRIQGLRVCLVDDVLTTGATASAAALACLAAGAARVEVRTLARAP